MRVRSLLGIASVAALVSAGAWTGAAPTGAGGTPSTDFTADGTYEVPADVCQVTIAAWGGTGGTGGDGSGGAAGRIQGTFPVLPGDVLDVSVGLAGEDATVTGALGGTGFNDGGDADGEGGGGGGGSSAVVNDGDILIVAGGGGGGGTSGDGGDGGIGGFGSGDGETGTGSGGATGGTAGDPNTNAGDGGDGFDAAGAGGGAGSAPGDGVGDNSGGGGGGASAVNGDDLFPTDPGAIDPGDGLVRIIPGDPGLDCAPTLAVAKVVSGTAPSGFAVHVVCTAEEEEPPASVEAQATVTVLDDSLPYTAAGEPDMSNPPAGWTSVSGVWVTSDLELEGATCTATETETAGAISVTYECAWQAGVVDHLVGVGCPGEASGPSATPESVTFEGNGDIGLLTVTNTFPVEVQPNFTG